jgi:deoxyuridine 5'-triphosphate nucleotidohydrolase
MELPLGCYGQIADRSSMAFNNHIHVIGGVIDSDYRGPIQIILHNLGHEPYHIQRGDKVAQIILQKILLLEQLVEVNVR